MSKFSFHLWKLRVGVRALVVVCLLVMCGPLLMAQTASTGALTGTVRDASGALIPNATVTATSLDTGQARTATTGGDGSLQICLAATRQLSTEN